ncbi:hypothetical protein ACLOJK_031797 [Asimina triloba]
MDAWGGHENVNKGEVTTPPRSAEARQPAGKADRRQETPIQSPAPVMAAGLAATQNPRKYPRAVFLSASDSAARLRSKFLKGTPRSDKLCNPRIGFLSIFLFLLHGCFLSISFFLLFFCEAVSFLFLSSFLGVNVWSQFSFE